MIKENIGKKIRDIRLQKNLSQEKLAELADIDRTYITCVEKAKKNVSVETLYKITEALEVSLEDFFSDIDNLTFEKLNSERLIMDLGDLAVGKAYTNLEVASIFLCSFQGGMRVSKRRNCVVLISSENKKDNPYLDSSINSNGEFIYTGMGLHGNQIVSPSNQNGKVAFSNSNGYQLHYFILRECNAYEYIGRVKLVDKHFFVDEKGIDGENRKVVKFHLKLV